MHLRDILHARDYIAASTRVSTYAAEYINASIKDENSSLKRESREI